MATEVLFNLTSQQSIKQFPVEVFSYLCFYSRFLLSIFELKSSPPNFLPETIISMKISYCCCLFVMTLLWMVITRTSQEKARVKNADTSGETAGIWILDWEIMAIIFRLATVGLRICDWLSKNERWLQRREEVRDRYHQQKNQIWSKAHDVYSRKFKISN